MKLAKAILFTSVTTAALHAATVHYTCTTRYQFGNAGERTFDVSDQVGRAADGVLDPSNNIGRYAVRVVDPLQSGDPSLFRMQVTIDDGLNGQSVHTAGAVYKIGDAIHLGLYQGASYRALGELNCNPSAK